MLALLAGGCVASRVPAVPAGDAESTEGWLRRAAAEVPLRSRHHATADFEVLRRLAQRGDEEAVNAVIARQVASGPPIIGSVVLGLHDTADRERAKVWLTAGDERRAAEALARVSPRARDELLGDAARVAPDPQRAAAMAALMADERWRWRTLRGLLAHNDNRRDDERWVSAVAPHLPPEQRDLTLAASMAPSLVRAGQADAARASLRRAEDLLAADAPADLFDVPGRPGQATPHDERREGAFRLPAHAAMAEAYLLLGDAAAAARQVGAARQIAAGAGPGEHYAPLRVLVRRQADAGDVDGALETAEFGRDLEGGRTTYFHEELVGVLARRGLVERARAVAQAAGIADTPASRLAFVVSHARRGEVREALQLAAEQPPADGPPGKWAAVIGAAACDAGHVGAAETVADAIDEPLQAALLLRRVAEAHAAAGDTARASAALGRALAALPEVGEPRRGAEARRLFEQLLQLGDLAGAERAAEVVADDPVAPFARLSIAHARKGDGGAQRAALARAEEGLAQAAQGGAPAARVGGLAYTAAARALAGDDAGFHALMRDARRLAAAGDELRLGADNPWLPLADAYREAGRLNELPRQLDPLDRPDRVALCLAVFDTLARRGISS